MLVVMHGGRRGQYWDVYEAAWVPCPDMDEPDQHPRDEPSGQELLTADRVPEQGLAAPGV